MANNDPNDDDDIFRPPNKERGDINVDDYLSFPELAEFANVSMSGVTKWHKLGLFPNTIAIGKTKLVPRTDIENAIKTGSIRTLAAFTVKDLENYKGVGARKLYGYHAKTFGRSFIQQESLRDDTLIVKFPTDVALALVTEAKLRNKKPDEVVIEAVSEKLEKILEYLRTLKKTG